MSSAQGPTCCLAHVWLHLGRAAALTLEGAPSSSGLEGGQARAGDAHTRAPPGPSRGARPPEEQVRFVSLQQKGGQVGRTPGAKARAPHEAPESRGGGGGRACSSWDMTAARASGGGGAEPGGVWGPGEASSHRRVRTSCRDLPWEARGPWGSFMERSHALWLSTREPPEWGRGGSRSAEPVPASLERAAAPGPASALLPRWLWQG